MKAQKTGRHILLFLVAFSLILISNPEALACSNQDKTAHHQKSSKKKRSIAAAAEIEVIELSDSNEKKTKSSGKTKSKSRVVAPSRIRVIDSGQQVTPENFPIPDVDKTNQNLENSEVSTKNTKTTNPNPVRREMNDLPLTLEQ